MHGFSVPKLETIRIGIIGTGRRGSRFVIWLASIEGVEIKAICDLVPERVNAAIDSIKDFTHSPDAYSGSEHEWKKLCEREDIDFIYIGTPWLLHTPMAVYAMEHDKHVCVDRPAASTMDECWQLVETSERTRKHCTVSTHSCFSGLSAVALNMVRQGLFGDIIHGEGCYIHDRFDRLFNPKVFGTWRLDENATRNGNLYSDSGIDAVAPMMNINYGEKLDYLSSLSSNDFMLRTKAQNLAVTDPFWERYAKKLTFRGNMNITIIRTNNGRSIMIQHDTTSPRPRPGMGMISGTKGIFVFEKKTHSPDPRIATSHEGWLSEEEFKSLVEAYTPEMCKRFNEMYSQAGTGDRPGEYARVNEEHWRIIDCLHNGIPMDIDVYDAALYSAVGLLSEWSVANRSKPVKVPDFTSGAWKTNEPGMDIELQNGGGTTKLVSI